MSIIEVLENARYNLCECQIPQIQIPLAKEQLSNALDQINNGKGLYDEFDEE